MGSAAVFQAACQAACEPVNQNLTASAGAELRERHQIERAIASVEKLTQRDGIVTHEDQVTYCTQTPRPGFALLSLKTIVLSFPFVLNNPHLTVERPFGNFLNSAFYCLIFCP
jgi:hypothetical protein